MDNQGNQNLTFFHAPQTRSFGVLVLLKELGVDYTLKVLNMKAGEQRQAAYLQVNPMGKVPALLHDGALITEQAAVYMYLADQFPSAGLAPKIGDPLRGPYLRWMMFYGSCFEPAVIDRSHQRAAVAQGMGPYGDFDSMFNTLTAQLEKGPYMLGEQFSAADLLWGSALTWITMFKLLPETKVVQSYIDRINARPSVAWARAKDAELMAGMV
jgi:glutathione S-transferase